MSSRIDDDPVIRPTTHGLRAQRPADRAARAATAPPVVRARDVQAFLSRAERAIARHRALLDRLDAKIGDGDHGENMSVGFAGIVRSLQGDGVSDVGDLLRQVGHLLVAGVGGASGSLYGTAFIEAGLAVAGSTELREAELATAFEAAARGLARRGRCAVGDKTIFDAMRPAVDAFHDGIARGLGSVAALQLAAFAAQAGMRATTPLIARRGLAMRLGERSRGHQDPGATSCFLLVRAMLGRVADGQPSLPAPRRPVRAPRRRDGQ